MNKKENHIYSIDNKRSFKLNYDLIIKNLSEKKLIDKKLLKPNWKHNLLDIIDNINNNLDKLIGIDINLNIELSKTLTTDDDYFDRFFISGGLRNKNTLRKKEPGVLNLIKTFVLLNRNIDTAINDAFSSRSLGRLGTYYEIHFGDGKTDRAYSFIKKIIERRDFNEDFLYDFIRHENINQIQKVLNDILEKQSIEITIDSKFFIRRFLDKIDIYSDLAPKENIIKEDFIDKFKETRETKNKLSHNFFQGGIIGFFLLFLLNLSLFIYNFPNSRDITQFINNFLGNGIYLFSIELFIFIISLYCFKLYNFYSKLVELYDSHISLIESDFHYQTDPQLSTNVDPELVFHMRKENTQKIHNLPDKALNLLNSKTDINTHSDFSIKIIDKLIDKIK